MAIGQAIEEEKACYGIKRAITTPSKLARVSKTNIELVHGLETVRIPLFGFPGVQGSQILLFIRETLCGILVFTHSVGQSNTLRSKYVLAKIPNLPRFFMRSTCCGG
ncbi:hypothetical protein PITC_095570 [Penicillium italicum]|uniref:Uncharacterized protein n=1 Tax=Penicillium italicum TaxID=40296 RepID=A0A0A2KY10_PENIT|nr:hypothetical protein PITC_095570 [Penicillium italicum]